MLRVKIFRQAANDEERLEEAINVWLAENNGKITIVNKLQSTGGPIGEYVTISIFYKTR